MQKSIWRVRVHLPAPLRPFILQFTGRQRMRPLSSAPRTSHRPKTSVHAHERIATVAHQRNGRCTAPGRPPRPWRAAGRGVFIRARTAIHAQRKGWLARE